MTIEQFSQTVERVKELAAICEFVAAGRKVRVIPDEAVPVRLSARPRKLIAEDDFTLDCARMCL